MTCWAGGKAIGLVAAFVCGVVLASLVAPRDRSGAVEGVSRPNGKSLTPQLRAVRLSLVLLASAALCGSLPSGLAEPAVAPLIAAAMGAVNSTFTRGGEVSVGLTYMTGALVKAGQLFAARLRGQARNGWLRYAALWAAITAGSAAGALSYLAAGLPVLWAGVACLVLVTGMTGHRQRAQE